MPVLALGLGTLFPNSAKAGFGGFGLGLMIGQGFLGAKAPLDPLCNHPKLCSFAPAPKNAVHFLYGAALHRPALLPPLQSVFAKDTAFFSAKAQNSGIRLSRIPGIVCRFPAFASGNSCFISSPVQKLKNSAKQNSWRVCRFSLWNSGAVSGFGLGLLVSRGFLGAKAGFGGFGLWLLIRNGFLGAKVFFAVVREGVADKPGKILCSVFFVFSGVFGLAWKPGGAGILFFYRDFMERQLFWGKIMFFFCLSCCSP